MDIISTRKTVFKLLASFLKKNGVLDRYINAIKRESIYGGHWQDRKMREYLEAHPKASRIRILLETIKIIEVKNNYHCLLSGVFDWEIEEEEFAAANCINPEDMEEEWAPLNDEWEQLLDSKQISPNIHLNYQEEDDWL